MLSGPLADLSLESHRPPPSPSPRRSSIARAQPATWLSSQGANESPIGKRDIPHLCRKTGVDTYCCCFGCCCCSRCCSLLLSSSSSLSSSLLSSSLLSSSLLLLLLWYRHDTPIQILSPENERKVSYATQPSIHTLTAAAAMPHAAHPSTIGDAQLSPPLPRKGEIRVHSFSIPPPSPATRCASDHLMSPHAPCILTPPISFLPAALISPPTFLIAKRLVIFQWHQKALPISLSPVPSGFTYQRHKKTMPGATQNPYQFPLYSSGNKIKALPTGISTIPSVKSKALG